MRRKARSDSYGGQNTNRWLITYMDLITLLLAFFVLLVSISARDNKRYHKALGSLVGAFVPSLADRATGVKPVREAAKGDEEDWGKGSVDLDALQDLATSHNLGSELQVIKGHDSVGLRMAARVLFSPTSSEINPRVRNFLASLANKLAAGIDDIEIYGHSDRFETVDNPHWPNNSWELSGRRAQVVYNFLREQGVSTSTMSARGVGDNRPVVDSGASPAGRLENARIEIILKPTDSPKMPLSNPLPRHRESVEKKPFKNAGW